jgi:heme oxygenase (mycobilin-producing)
VTLINVLEVPAEADDAVVASWDDLLAARNSVGAAVLHRAWRPDAEFRFVVTAGAAGAWREVADPAVTEHPGVYEVVHEDGVPDGTQGVVLVNPFEVPSGEEERFVAGWTRVRDMLAPQRGYLGTRLHRAVGRADFRFVNIARWSSPLMFSRAIGRADVRQATAVMPFTSHPALYQVIRVAGQGFS